MKVRSHVSKCFAVAVVVVVVVAVVFVVVVSDVHTLYSSSLFVSLNSMH